MRRLIALLAFSASAYGIAAAATLAPSAIVANPSNYEGQTVTVSGKVAAFKTMSTPMGNTVAGFQLCDSKCVVVIDRTGKTQTNGAAATVTGTFHASFKAHKKTFTNAIVISK